MAVPKFQFLTKIDLKKIKVKLIIWFQLKVLLFYFLQFPKDFAKTSGAYIDIAWIIKTTNKKFKAKGRKLKEKKKIVPVNNGE